MGNTRYFSEILAARAAEVSTFAFLVCKAQNVISGQKPASSSKGLNFHPILSEFSSHRMGSPRPECQATAQTETSLSATCARAAPLCIRESWGGQAQQEEVNIIHGDIHLVQGEWVLQSLLKGGTSSLFYVPIRCSAECKIDRTEALTGCWGSALMCECIHILPLGQKTESCLHIGTCILSTNNFYSSKFSLGIFFFFPKLKYPQIKFLVWRRQNKSYANHFKVRGLW